MTKQEAQAALGLSRYKFSGLAKRMGITPLRSIRDYRERRYLRSDVERMRAELGGAEPIPTRSGSAHPRPRG